MFSLIRSKRGQIRGIDFSLALIIFSLTIAQVMILTNTFIESNRSQQDTLKRSSIAESFGNEILINPGLGANTSNWANISTSSLLASNWNFGLAGSGSSVSPFKLGRLSDLAINGWNLGYDDISIGLNISETFRIAVRSPINASIFSITDNAVDSLIVTGNLTKQSAPETGGQVWVFAIDSAQNVAQGFDITDTLGEFNATVNFGGLLANDYYTVIAIAQLGVGSQDISISSYTRGAFTLPSPTNTTIFESTNTYAGYTINATSDMTASVDSVMMTAVFPGTASGNQNFTQQAMAKIPATNRWEVDNLAIPQTGTVVMISQGLILGVLTQISVVNFPVVIDDEISQILKPSFVPLSSSSTAVITFISRGVLLQIEFTVWK